MRVVVVPPITDPTVTVAVGAGEWLLDLNWHFGLRAADPAVLKATAAALDTTAAGGPGAAHCLLARAAADVFAQPAADQVTWLRALGASIRAISALDPGISASIDDVELRTGSTECGADAMLAASRCTLFDPELSAVPAAADELYLVLDSDQQLPAALRLLGRRPAGQACTVGGRFVAAHREALSRLPALAGVRLDPLVRQRVIDPHWSPGRQAGLRWCGGPAERPGADAWAGWLDARTFGALGTAELDRCAGLVVSVTGSARETAAGAALAALATRIPVAVEVVAGTPGEDVSPHAWWAQPGSVRLAGFRPYRPPLPGGTAPPPGRDLARWAAPATAAVMAEVDGLLARYAARRDLFPGRVAGALFARPAQRHLRVWGEHCWDPAVRLVQTEHTAPDDRAPGHFLVNLRSGSLTRVRPALTGLLTRIRLGGPPAERVIGALPAGRRERLLTSLVAAGAMNKVAMGRPAA